MLKICLVMVRAKSCSNTLLKHPTHDNWLGVERLPRLIIVLEVIMGQCWPSSTTPANGEVNKGSRIQGSQQNKVHV